MSEKNKTIKKQMQKLDELVAYFEKSDDEFDLDEGIKKYAEAMDLAVKMRKELEAIELKINEIKAKYEED